MAQRRITKVISAAKQLMKASGEVAKGQDGLVFRDAVAFAIEIVRFDDEPATGGEDDSGEPGKEAA